MRTNRAEIVVGLGFGDEGKGTTIDWLTRQRDARCVVRFNGGAQAGHNVVLPNGKHHCFAQFGSGTFAGARTFLSRYMLVNPLFALNEAKVLADKGVRDPLALLTVDEDALVTTPFHVCLNRLRELARSNRHGSCGMGIGETVADSLAFGEDEVVRVRDLRDPPILESKLRRIQARKLLEMAEPLRAMIQDADREAARAVTRELDVMCSSSIVESVLDRYAHFAEAARIVDGCWLERELARPGAILFEGAQGVLLDQTYGFNPHTTWSDCTFANALTLIGDADVEIRRLGVTRSFPTRHGAGPFVTETSGFLPLVTRDHNGHGAWQGEFRIGALDIVALRYALEVVSKIDGLVMTWVDAIGPGVLVCTGYEHGGMQFKLSRHNVSEERTQQLFAIGPIYANVGGRDLPEYVADTLGVPLVLTSSGPTHLDKSPTDGPLAAW